MRARTTISERLDHDNAILEFQHASSRGPERAEYQFLLGREEFALGNWELAANSYRRAAEISPSLALYHLSLGDAEFRAENYGVQPRHSKEQQSWIQRLLTSNT